ncbi:3826_t:CDS:2, partial [Cetraspora pellucida]
PQAPQPQISQPAISNPALNPTQASALASNPTQASVPVSTPIPDVSSRPIFIFTDSIPFYGKIGYNVTFNWKYSGQFDFLTQYLVAVAVYNYSTYINWTISSNLSTSTTTVTWVTSTIINPTLVEGPYTLNIFNGSDYNFTIQRPVALTKFSFFMYQPKPQCVESRLLSAILYIDRSRWRIFGCID